MQFCFVDNVTAAYKMSRETFVQTNLHNLKLVMYFMVSKRRFTAVEIAG